MNNTDWHFISNKPDRCKNNCELTCIYNATYRLSRAGVINLDCNLVISITEQVTQECQRCGHKFGCERNDVAKANCALDSRPRERARVSRLSDNEIIEYLAYLPSPKCNHVQTDVWTIAKNMAHWADIEMFEQTHGNWDIESHPEEFISQARIEAERNKVMKLNNIGDFELECINCPDDVSAFCRGMLPEGWVGFPDIYLAEAAWRKILSKIKEH